MTKYLVHPVAYLQVSDFNSNGQLTNPLLTKGRVFIMLQAIFCGHCTTSKPAFQQLTNKYSGKGNVIFATVQGDGTEKGEKDLSQMMTKLIPGFKGFPTYVLYENGSFKTTFEGGRSVEAMEKFLGF